MSRKKATNSKLQKYSALSITYIALQNATTAQVVYADIEPDIVLDEAAEGYWLDMDDNGTLDFAFLNSSFTFFSYSFASYMTRQDILAGPYISQNGIAGNFDPGTFTESFPYAMEQGSVIGNSLNWNTFGIQLMAIKTIYHYGDDTMHCLLCNWYSFYMPEVLDHYLGIRFIDEDNQHYGWIRCDVKDAGRTLVIKDYAYEVQPGNPILAGDTTHYVSINETENTLDAVVYSYAKNIYIQKTEANTEVKVYDVTGKEILRELTTTGLNIFDMRKFSAGVYVVAMQNGSKAYRKKVCIQ